MVPYTIVVLDVEQPTLKKRGRLGVRTPQSAPNRNLHLVSPSKVDRDYLLSPGGVRGLSLASSVWRTSAKASSR